MLHPKFRVGYTYSIHKAVTQVVPSGLRSLIRPVPSKKTIYPCPPSRKLLPPFSIYSHSFIGQIHFPIRIPCAISGPGVSTQYRFGHTDLPWPDYSPYRRNSCKSNLKTEAAEERKLMSYVIASVGFTAGLYGVKSVLIHYIACLAATADVLALAKIEVNLCDIPEGTVRVYKWRGKPLYVAHRTPADIKRERSVDISTLRDPQEDSDRVQNESWLVVLGVCTHLGCVPAPNAGDYNGYYCPCHGSHFDGSGRARKGPAPTNLEVPIYSFLDPDTIVVG